MSKILLKHDELLALHSEQRGGYNWRYFVQGKNPFGPRGGKCGHWEEGKIVSGEYGSSSSFSYATRKIDEIHSYVKETKHNVTVDFDYLIEIGRKRTVKAQNDLFKKYVRELFEGCKKIEKKMVLFKCDRCGERKNESSGFVQIRKVNEGIVVAEGNGRMEDFPEKKKHPKIEEIHYIFHYVFKDACYKERTVCKSCMKKAFQTLEEPKHRLKMVFKRKVK